MQRAATSASLVIAQDLFAKGKNFEEIQKHLTHAGYPAEEIAGVMAHIKDMRYEKQRRVGLPLIAAGVVLCVTGFILVVSASHTGTVFNVVLYGMTSLGGATIMGGLFTILG